MDRIDFLKSIDDGSTATSIESLNVFFDHYMSAYELMNDTNYTSIISHPSGNHISLTITTSEEEKNNLIDKINKLNNYMISYGNNINISITEFNNNSVTIDFKSL